MKTQTPPTPYYTTVVCTPHAKLSVTDVPSLQNEQTHVVRSSNTIHPCQRLKLRRHSVKVKFKNKKYLILEQTTSVT